MFMQELLTLIFDLFIMTMSTNLLLCMDSNQINFYKLFPVKKIHILTKLTYHNDFLR